MERGKTRGSLKPVTTPLSAQEGNDPGHLRSKSQAGPIRMSCKQGLHCDLRLSHVPFTQAGNTRLLEVLIPTPCLSLPHLSLGVMNRRLYHIQDTHNRPRNSLTLAQCEAVSLLALFTRAWVGATHRQVKGSYITGKSHPDSG